MRPHNGSAAPGSAGQLHRAAPPSTPPGTPPGGSAPNPSGPPGRGYPRPRGGRFILGSPVARRAHTPRPPVRNLGVKKCHPISARTTPTPASPRKSAPAASRLRSQLTRVSGTRSRPRPSISGPRTGRGSGSARPRAVWGCSTPPVTLERLTRSTRSATPAAGRTCAERRPTASAQSRS